MRKKLLPLFLALALCVGTLPAQALAAEGELPEAPPAADILPEAPPAENDPPAKNDPRLRA